MADQEELIFTLYSRWNWYLDLPETLKEEYNSTRMLPVEETMELLLHFRFFEEFGEAQSKESSLRDDELIEAHAARRKKDQQRRVKLAQKVYFGKLPPEKIDKQAGRSNGWSKPIPKWEELTPQQKLRRIQIRRACKRFRAKQRKFKEMNNE